ncbi:MAG: NUDIX hydrolase, partial [Myxococcaceae bacterium]
MLLLSLLVTAGLSTVPDEKVKTALAQTQTLRLHSERSTLTPGEQTALFHLLKVGALFQELYEDQCHPDAAAMRRKLVKSPNADIQSLWRVAQGPVYTTVDNRREAFLPVRPETPARNVYPPDVTREELEVYLTAHPAERALLLDEHTVVRRTTRENLRRDRQALARSAVLAFLHPGLDDRLAALKPDAAGFYAVPQAVAYDETVMAASRQLMAAADALEADDSEFARYLRQRARDLLTNDYEAGDAAWLTGNFKRLNAQIGAYESYDDGLYGVKAFFGLSLMIRDEVATRALEVELQ